MNYDNYETLRYERPTIHILSCYSLGHEVKDPETMKIFEEVHLHIIPYLNLPSIEEAATIYQNYSCEEVPNGLGSTSVSSAHKQIEVLGLRKPFVLCNKVYLPYIS